ncbi:MAG: aldehyde dehydrogenase family protein [Akkermansiaceae bacterium]|nr:aldehyde dehydrogenase family protein [Akkermansiaceae bacterium]
MGDLNISAILNEAKDRKWDDRTLAQRAVDFAEKLRDDSIRRLTSDERALLSALSRLAADEKNREFLVHLCDEVLRGSSEEKQCETLRKQLSDFGGVPTFFGAMARLRFKAAAIASRGMQGAALNEIRRIFRNTFGELTLPTRLDKVDKKVKEWSKHKLIPALSPLSPTVFGPKAADKYARHLESILSRQTGVGLTIQPWRLCPALSHFAPDSGAKELAKKLTHIIHAAISGGLSIPLIVETGTSDLQPVIISGIKQALANPDLQQANIAIELPAYLNNAQAVLRELTEWSNTRTAKGAKPLQVLIVKGSHLNQERIKHFEYGDQNAAAPNKAVTDARFKKLVHAAISTSPKLITPLIGTHNLFDISYALLDWGRCGRVGLPHFVFRAGLGNHIGRSLTREGATVILSAGIESEDAETDGFETHLLHLLNELSRPDGYLTHGYAPEPDSMGWNRMRQHFLAALSGREEDPIAPFKGADDFIPGNLAQSTEEAYTARFFAAAEQEQERTQAPIPLSIGGQTVETPLTCIHRSLTAPGIEDYRYTSADFETVNAILDIAQSAGKQKKAPPEPYRYVHKLAKLLHKHRAELGALLVRDAGFNYRDSEHELLYATDACYYYAQSAERDGLKDGTTPAPRGIVVIAPGHIHPLADAVAAIAAATLTGNAIIYKPASGNVLLGRKLADLVQEAGICEPYFQFVPCLDNQIAVKLMTSPCISAIIADSTLYDTQRLAEKAPAAVICSQPAGNTAAYLAPTADWQQAVRDLAQHAFRRSGQSPTCPHVVIVHSAIYDNQLFINALKDAVSTCTAAPGRHQEAHIGPLAAPLSPQERRELSCVHGKETWLLKPTGEAPDTLIFTPGIRTGVAIDSPLLQHIHKLPILALIRVENTEQATALQETICNGQAAILYSQDPAEYTTWQKALADCSALYHNCCPQARPALQPFGSWSPHTPGAPAVPGGKNYLIALCHWQETARPQRRGKQRNISFTPWEVLVPKPTPDETMRLTAAADSISYWWENEFGITHQLTPHPGLCTTLQYRPRPVCLRAENDTTDTEISLFLMAALKAGCEIHLSTATLRPWMPRHLEGLGIRVTLENRMTYLERIPELATAGIALRDPAATPEDLAIATACGTCINTAPILANGRIEQLHYLREQYITAKRSTPTK